MKAKFLFLVLMLLSMSFLTACNDMAGEKTNQSSEIESYRIRFFVDDELYHTVKFEIGEKIELPEEPEKDGYTFAGWVSKDGDEIDFSNINKNMSVYAKFVDSDGETMETPLDHEHVFDEYKGNNQCHWLVCSICNATTAKEEHVGGVATEIELAKCYKCGMSYGDYASSETHTHKYSGEYYSDEYGHWRYCSCGEKSFRENHFGGVATETERAKCRTCGAYYGDYKNHYHNLVEEFESLGNCDIDGYNLTVYCTTCDYRDVCHNTGHYYEQISDEIASYGCGTIYIYYDVCKICGICNGVSIEGNCNFETISDYEEHNDDRSVHYIEYGCSNCSNKISEVDTTYKKDEKCLVVNTYSYVVYGKETKSYEAMSYCSNHINSYQVENYDGNEYDTYDVIAKCKDCGFVETHYDVTCHFYADRYSKFDLSCLTVEIIEYGCVACRDGYGLWYGTLNGDFKQYFENGDDLTWSCENGCCQLQICKTGETILNNCEKIIHKSLAIYSNGNEIAKYYFDEHETNHKHIYNPIFYGNGCESGHDLKITCENCDYYEEITGIWGHWHSSTRETYEEFCGKLTLITDGCVSCGYDQRSWVDEQISWNNYEYSDTYKLYRCDNGCCSRAEYYEYIYDENCNRTIVRTTVYSHDGVEVFRYTSYEYDQYHEYEMTYEMIGESCDEGYYKVYTCIRCGESYNEYSSGHLIEYYNSEVYKDSYCGSIFNYSICKICNYLSYYNYYDMCKWIYNEGATPYYKCETCGAIKWQSSYREDIDLCHYKITTHIYIEYNNEVVQDVTYYDIYDDHNFVYSVNMFGQECKDGLDVTKTCADCSDVNEYFTYWDHYIVDEYVEVGGCGTKVILHNCIGCNELINFDYYGYTYCFNYYGEVDGKTIYKCDVCGLEKVSYDEIVYEDECITELSVHTSFVVNGETILYLNTRFVREHHETEPRVENFTGNCSDEHLVIEKCKNCDYERSYYSYYHYNVMDYITLPGLCGTVVYHRNGCFFCQEYPLTEYTDDYMNWDLVDTELNVLEHYECYNGCCEKVIRHRYEYNDYCYYYRISTITYLANGEVILSYEMKETLYNHNLKTTYVMHGTTCYDGYDYKSVCTKCGEEFVGTDYGHRLVTTKTRVECYGSCGLDVVDYDCEVCGLDLYWELENVNCDIELISSGNGITTERCNRCNSLFEKEVVYEGKIENCVNLYNTYLTISMSNYVIYNGVLASSDVRHTEGYDYYDYTGNCEDGFHYSLICVDCGYVFDTNLYSSSHHAFNNDVDFNLNCGTFHHNHRYCNACGMTLYRYTDEYISWNNVEYTDFVYESYVCQNGCCQRTIEFELAYEDACKSEYNVTYTYLSNDEIIFQYTNLNTYDHHQYDYEVLNENSNCNEPYILKYTCKNCGISHDSHTIGHYYDLKVYEINKNGCCGLKIVASACVVCDNIETYYFEYNNCNSGIILMEENYLVYECNACGLLTTVTRTYLDNDRICDDEYIETTEFILNGEVLCELKEHGKENFHNCERFFTAFGQTCEEGIEVLYQCKDCDYSSYTTYYSHVWDYNDIYYEHEGYCGSSWVINECAYCHERFEGYSEQCNWNFEGYVDACSKYTCTSCGAIKMAYLEGFYDEYNVYKERLYVYVYYNDELIVDTIIYY